MPELEEEWCPRAPVPLPAPSPTVHVIHELEALRTVLRELEVNADESHQADGNQSTQAGEKKPEEDHGRR